MRPPNKRQTFWLLMALSVVMMWLPAGSTRWMRQISDTVVAPLSWLHRGGQELRRRADELTARPAQIRDAREMQRQIDDLKSAVVALRRKLAEERARTAEATGLRADLLGPRGRLVPADVLLRDAVAWRESVLIDRGQNLKLSAKQWAVSRLFLDRGELSRVLPETWAAVPLSSQPGRNLLYRAVVVGRIERVGRVTSRVRLLTDPDSQVQVQVYHPASGKLEANNCVLTGQGPGQLKVERITRARAGAGEQVSRGPPADKGDLVLTAAGTANLPAQLLVGQVVAVRPLDKDPLGYELEVQPAIDYAQLRRVWIVDPVSGPEGER